MTATQRTVQRRRDDSAAGALAAPGATLDADHDPRVPASAIGEGATPLMYACQQGREREVRRILSVRPEAALDRDRTRKTALHYCAEAASVSCAEAVLASGGETLLHMRDEDGYAPLHLAVIAGNRPLIRMLLARGADANCLDRERHSLVHWATVCGEAEALDLVLDAGADPSTPDIHGGYPVHYAAQMCGPTAELGRDVRFGLAVLRRLLTRGVPVGVADRDGRQPILWAASAGSSDAILALVSAGASVEADDKDGLTALHCAASRGHTDCLETLVTLCGAEVDVIDTNGCSALFYTVTLGHADATRLLLGYGAEPNRQDRKGRTPAHCGAAKGQLETLRLLETHGANLWVRNVRGDYPLQEAVASGRRELVQWLLAQRSSAADAPNNDGRCSLHVAALHGNMDMVKILLDQQALLNPVMRSSRGQLLTPMDAALARGHRSCAKYLQLHGGVPAARLTERSARVRGSVSKAAAWDAHSEPTGGGERSLPLPRGGLSLASSPMAELLQRPTGPGAAAVADSTEQARVHDELALRHVERMEGSGVRSVAGAAGEPCRRRHLPASAHPARAYADSSEEERTCRQRRRRRRRAHCSGHGHSHSHGHGGCEHACTRGGEHAAGGRRRCAHSPPSEEDASGRSRDRRRRRRRGGSSSSSGAACEGGRRRSSERRRRRRTRHMADSLSDGGSASDASDAASDEPCCPRAARRLEKRRSAASATAATADAGDARTRRPRTAGRRPKSARVRADRAPEAAAQDDEDSDAVVTADTAPEVRRRVRQEERVAAEQRLSQTSGEAVATRLLVTAQIHRQRSTASEISEVVEAVAPASVPAPTPAAAPASSSASAATRPRKKTRFSGVTDSGEEEQDAGTEQQIEDESHAATNEDVAAKEEEEKEGSVEGSGDGGGDGGGEIGREGGEEGGEEGTENGGDQAEAAGDQTSELPAATEEDSRAEAESVAAESEGPETTARAADGEAEGEGGEDTTVAVDEPGAGGEEEEPTAEGTEEVEGEATKEETEVLAEEGKDEDGEEAGAEPHESAPVPSPASPETTPEGEEGREAEETGAEAVATQSTEEKGEAASHEEDKEETGSEDGKKGNEEKAKQDEGAQEENGDKSPAEDDGDAEYSHDEFEEEDEDGDEEVDATERFVSEDEDGGGGAEEEDDGTAARTADTASVAAASDSDREMQDLEHDASGRTSSSRNGADSGIEPSPRRDTSASGGGGAEAEGGGGAATRPRIARPCRDGDERPELTSASVTQAVQHSVRKYQAERLIFGQLLELKRLQIRAGRANEAVLAKRLSDELRRAAVPGARAFPGPYTLRALERHLYEQLRLLQAGDRRMVPRLRTHDDLEKLQQALRRARLNNTLHEVPDNPVLCTHGTHRCHHAAHAYTGVPCAAYITKGPHLHSGRRTTGRGAGDTTGFLPRIDSSTASRSLRCVDPSRPVTLELSHGKDKQVISLPTDKLDRNKRYYVTFTIKGGASGAGVDGGVSSGSGKSSRAAGVKGEKGTQGSTSAKSMRHHHAESF